MRREIESDDLHAYTPLVRPRLQAETSVEARSTVWRTPAATWTVTTQERLIVLDDRLEPVAGFPLPAGWPGLHAVTPDGLWAALSLPDRVSLVGADGTRAWEVRHQPWPDGGSGSAWITPGGLIWAVVPGADGLGSPDRWWVLEATRGTLLADFCLDGSSSGSEPIGHAGGVLLSLSGRVDDGARIYHGRCRSGELLVDPMPGSDRVLADVHRRGDRYLTTDRHHEGVAVHALTDGTVLATRRAEQIFGADDFVDFRGAFVTDDRVVVRSVLAQEHVVLDVGTLHLLEAIEYPEDAARDAVLPTGDGRWVTTDWLDGRLQLWTA
jgi:hypothetical protein